MKHREHAKIVRQEELSPGIFSMWVTAPKIAEEALPGQFVMINSNDKSKILPRPLCICDANKDEGLLRVVYRVVGEGTKEFSALRAGDFLYVMGPLGNGYPLDGDYSSPILIGGGLGLPNLLMLSRTLPGNKNIILGYRDSHLFLEEEFMANGRVTIATDDGSLGVFGNVLDAIKERDIEGDVIFACGPAPMLRGVKAYAEEKGIPCFVSMEERMACGLGACLACVCKSKDVDSHSNVRNKRVCKDGPVFNANEIEF